VTHLVLVGMMGTGKTTVGTRLAERLRRPLVDSDALIEATTGRTVREIFLDDGEEAFRALETAALVGALGADAPLVVAAAGGVVLREQNRRALLDADAVVVWLRADPSLLVDRVGSGDHRPLLDGDPAGTLQRMFVERAPWYREVADAVVDVDDRTVDEVVDAVVDAMVAVLDRTP
jgi:shikimate kinase